jgi:hypothetical protein
MLSAFHADAVVHHFHSKIQGLSEMRTFFQQEYVYLIPGVSRHATNHVVDRDGEHEVTIRYHQHLVRYASPKEGQKAPGDHAGSLLEHESGLPSIWVFSHVVDRLRQTDQGEWKISERYLGVSAVNRKLDPPKAGHTEDEIHSQIYS